MADLAKSHPTPAQAYAATLFSALGSLNPRDVLGETPALLRQAVAGLSREQLSTPEAPGKWSVRHVVQHLADSELVGAFRFRMVLAHDAPSLPGYDQDLWASRLRYQDADIEAALSDFDMLRRSNLRLCDGASAADLKRVMRHSERGDESLEYMLRMYAGHDLVHLRQVGRVLRVLRV
jgi:hypothetical protein